MRNIAYRRAQQSRMIARAKRSNVLSVMTGATSDIPAGYFKSWANNLAKCSCDMCTSHGGELTRAALRNDAATRDQMEEL